MPRGFLHFDYSSEIKNIFTSHKSLQPTDHALLSPRLWEILAKYISIFQHFSVLPFYFSVTERKLFFVRESFVKRVILKFSCILYIAYALFTFLLLTHKLLFSENLNVMTRSVETRRIFTMFYIVCLFPIFIPTSFLIAFRGKLISLMINPINLFHQRVSGNEQHLNDKFGLLEIRYGQAGIDFSLLK